MNSAVTSSIESSVKTPSLVSGDRTRREFQSWGYAVAVLVGLVLLAAGVLKLSSLAPGLDFGRTITNRAWLLFGLAISEIVLGIWLLSGLRPRWVWGLAILFFSGTTAHGAWMLARGQTTCPCFGDFKTPTALTLGISVLCLFALFAFPTKAAVVGIAKSWLTPPFVLGVVGSAFCAIAIVDGLFSSESSSGLVGVLNRQHTSIQLISAPIPVDYFEEMSVKLPLVITNDSASKSISVIGWTHGCGAICEINDVPALVPANESRTLWVTVRRPAVPNELIKSGVQAYCAMEAPPLDLTKPAIIPITVLTSDGVGPVKTSAVFVTLVPTPEYLERFENTRKSLKPVRQ